MVDLHELVGLYKQLTLVAVPLVVFVEFLLLRKEIETVFEVYFLLRGFELLVAGEFEVLFQVYLHLVIGLVFHSEKVLWRGDRPLGFDELSKGFENLM